MNTGRGTESLRPRLARLVATIEDGILVTLVLGMILLGALQILLRNVFDVALVWADPLLRSAVLWVGLLGAMVASRTEHHIRIDVLSRYLPPALRVVSDVTTHLFACAVCALLAWLSVRFVAMDQAAETIAFGEVRSWVVETVLPVGFAIIALRYLFAAVRAVHRRGEPDV